MMKSLADREADALYLEGKIVKARSLAEKADLEGKAHMLWGDVLYYETQWTQNQEKIKEIRKEKEQKKGSNNEK